MRHLPLLLLLLAACPPKPDRSGRQIDVSRFRRTLQCANRSVPFSADCAPYRKDGERIESIHIEPAGSGTARYVITYRDTNKREHALGEFPGKITDEIVAAEIPYNVATE